MPAQYFTLSDAARELGRTPYLIDIQTKKLGLQKRTTAGGTVLLTRSEVERLRRYKPRRGNPNWVKGVPQGKRSEAREQNENG